MRINYACINLEIIKNLKQKYVIFTYEIKKVPIFQGTTRKAKYVWLLIIALVLSAVRIYDLFLYGK